MFLITSCGQNPTDLKDQGVIQYEKFKQMAIDSKKEMCDSTSTLSAEKAIYLTRVFNTITMYTLEDKDSLFAGVSSAFAKCSTQRVINTLDMHLSIGMSYYSKKYDIYLGAFKSATNSYFQLDSLSLMAPKK